MGEVRQLQSYLTSVGNRGRLRVLMAERPHAKEIRKVELGDSGLRDLLVVDSD